jgi:hypothetical protein
VNAHPGLPPVRPGDVLLLKDDDYLFGQGDLVVRVVTIHDVRWLKRAPWLFLRAMELRADGTGCRIRDILVRCAVLPLRRRQPS